MAERPILFSGPMVRAILEGRKTQTRRVITPQPARAPTPCHYVSSGWSIEGLPDEHGVKGCVCSAGTVRNPYGVPGDTLWVRETFLPRAAGASWIYRADLDPVEAAGIAGMYSERGWKPGIHMPRAASRLSLHVVAVRPERLQEISEADAKAEGMPHDSWGGDRGYRDCFELGWDHINGKRAPWASNPWVWVIEFEPVRATTGSAPPREAGGS